MTAYEIVKAAYSGIPDAILNQYADLLPAEASGLSAEYAAGDTIFFPVYRANVTSLRLPSATFRYAHPNVDARYIIMQASFTLLKPENVNDTVNVNLQAAFWASDTIILRSPPPHTEGGDSGTRYAIYNLKYDRRLFANPSLKLLGRGFVPAPGQGAMYINQRYWALTTQGAALLIDRAPYSGIESIKILHENGVSIAEIDYRRVYEFCTYINAYKKFSTQVDAEKALLEQRAKNNVDAYRQQLNDQAAREYSDLQSKKIQLLITIDNEAKSAQRDYQNMLLTAQTLKQQIGGALGN